MLKLKFKLFISLLLLLLPFTSANLIVNQSVNVSKTFGINTQSSFILINTENYPFYNVTFENNNIVSMTKLDTIASGNIVSIPFTVISDVPGNYNIKVKGFKINNIGTSNQTYNININDYANPNPCDFTIIQGDRVIWKSNVNNQVTIKNRETNSIITTLTNGQTYTYITSLPQILKYSLEVAGFVFSACNINILDTNGLVNDPLKDGILNLSININYELTILNATYTTTNYTMNFYDTTDGIILLKNIGTKTAQHVTLNGEWTTFNGNDFSLNSGETKAIIYTITPSISQTSQTNLTYSKIIRITGNFPEIDQSINIYINPATIDFSNQSQESVNYLINVFCPKYPTSILCGQNQTVIYKYISNASDNQFNVTMSQSQVKELWLFMLEEGENRKTLDNYMKLTVDELNNKINQTTANVDILTSASIQRDIDAKNTITSWIVGVAIFLTLVSVGIGFFVFFYFKKYKLAEEIRRW